MPATKSLVAYRSLQSAFLRGSRFLRKRPLLSKAIPTACGFAFGDLLTQYMHRKPLASHWSPDLSKTAAMFGCGAVLAAPVGLGLLRWLDVVWPSMHVLAISTKLTIDQIVGCLIWQCAYCSICESYRVMLVGWLTRSSDTTASNRADVSLQ